MVFSSITFIFIFLPVVLVLYTIAEQTKRVELKNAVLLLASLLFYAFGGVQYLFLLIILACVNYVCGIQIAANKYKKLFFVIALAVDILDLIFFKYLTFLLSNVDHLLQKTTGNTFADSIPQIVMPIGISFFTFQIMSYVIDVYFERVPAQKNFFRLLLYIMMFPQLIAGPIVRYSDVNKEIEDRHTTLDMAERGIRRFIAGLAKKVFVANTMGSMADAVFNQVITINSPEAWIGALSYTLQIYYDFSAYSDMAIGLGLIFGFHFNENFNYPYISTSIKDFWRRWHISLSTWFRDYVYIPLGGNRNGKARTYLNLWIVFLLTGIWHGAAWQFIVWGLYHGAFMFLERLGFGKLLEKIPMFFRRIYTLVVVIVGWVFFRADSLPIAVSYIKKMFSFDFSGFKTGIVMYNLSNWYIFMLAVAFIVSAPVSKRLGKNKYIGRLANVASIMLFCFTMIYLSGLSYNPFIYFKF